MRSYTISPMSSAASSVYPSPFSSRSTSPHSQNYATADGADVQATPRASISISASQQLSDMNHFPSDPQHWDGTTQFQLVHAPDSLYSSSLPVALEERFSLPGEMEYSPVGENNDVRPLLFSHHTTSGVVRSGQGVGGDGPYSKRTQFVHIPVAHLQGAPPRLRTQQACESCRKRKAKVRLTSPS